jgi:hypothetical protein
MIINAVSVAGYSVSHNDVGAPSASCGGETVACSLYGEAGVVLDIDPQGMVRIGAVLIPRDNCHNNIFDVTIMSIPTIQSVEAIVSAENTSEESKDDDCNCAADKKKCASRGHQ